MDTILDVTGATADRIADDLADLLPIGPDDSVTIDADVDAVPTALFDDVIAAHGPHRWTVEAASPARVRLTAARTDLGRPEVDVRDIPPSDRHEVLLGLAAALEAGDAFALVNDHDPKPLYYELRSTYGDAIEWRYEREAPGEWIVTIGASDGMPEAPTDDVASRFDVRDIPKPDRHPTIHHRFGNLGPGDAMELIAPHEPRHLHEEFDRRYGDAFDWTIVDEAPGRCVVRIVKGGPDDASPAADSAAEPATEDDLTVVEELDVRSLAPAQRHERIFARYDGLAAGEAFELVNDHDPKPLYYQFEAEAGPAFRWAYRRQEPGEFRVLIGKAAGVDESAEAPTNRTEPPF